MACRTADKEKQSAQKSDGGRQKGRRVNVERSINAGWRQGCVVTPIRKSGKSIDGPSINNDNDSHMKTRRPA
jgi:hypothetical protein